jgi:hypothetical protein
VSISWISEASQQHFLTLYASEKCCCSHCSTSSSVLNKELDPLLESDSEDVSASSTIENDCLRPVAIRTQSESDLINFTNRHHKPVQGCSNTAHICGMPYVVQSAHLIHAPSPLDSASKAIDILQHTPTIDALYDESRMKDSMIGSQREQRIVKSEHGSPVLSPPHPDCLNGSLPPLDLSTTLEDYSILQNLDSFSASPDGEQPLFSSLLSSAPIDWSHYDSLDFNDYTFAASP